MITSAVFIRYEKDKNFDEFDNDSYIYFCSPCPWKLCMKVGFDRPSGFGADGLENDVRRIADGQTPEDAYTIISSC